MDDEDGGQQQVNGKRVGSAFESDALPFSEISDPIS